MIDGNGTPGAEGLDIAVIAMTGRFPGAPDLDRFWHNLRHGVESITFHSVEELVARGGDPAAVSDPSYVRASALVADVDLFDAGFFGFSPREAEAMDPQQRVFLECAWEALEQAGYDSARTPGMTGVYAASGINEYLFFHLLPGLTDLRNVLQLSIGNEKDFLATRVSYELDLRGPSLNVQTGCSSGLVAVHLACQALLAWQCDLALAGGISLQLPRIPGYLYQPSGILSPDGHCRSFSAEARGTVPASGAGVVVLKRLADAIADGDTIRAVIKGSALNNDGGGKLGFTAPGIEGQARVIDLAHAAAAVDPRSISYVEGHGSATPLGDPIEVAALTRAFRAGTADRQFCALGSVKSNIGHTDTAAGLAGLIKTVLALEHGEIPPTVGFDRPNPQIDLAESPFFVNRELIPWVPTPGPRRAGVSSFGIGGTNAHVVLEQAPEVAASGADRPWEVLVLSARSAAALEAATDRLADRLAAALPRGPGKESDRSDRSDGSDGAAGEGRLSDVAWTLQAGRRRFAHRRVVVCRGGEVEEAARALRERDPRRLLEGFDEAGERPVAFLFPGLGDHYPGMAAGLYRDEPVFRREIDRAAEILEPLLDADLRNLIFSGGEGRGAGPDLRAMLHRTDPLAGSPLARTAVAQPALFAVELALARLWMSWGLRPAALLGYSLGEYVAACVAGVLSEDDALRVVAERARLIEELPAGAMLAVALPEEETAPLLGPGLSVAAVNGPMLTVVSGLPGEIEGLAQRLADRGVAARALPTTHAFHSPALKPIAGAVRELLAGVRLRAPEIPYVSNATGTWITAQEATDPDSWVAQMLRPVRFGAGLAALWQDPARALLEVGPGQGLGSLALQHPGAPAGGLVVSSLRGAWEDRPDGAVLLGALGRLWIAGCRIDWAGFQAGARRRRVPLPTYPFERQRYWVGEAPAAPAAPVTAAPASRHARPALRTPWVEPATELERAVAGLWERLLGIGGIGAHDNFFELGGHSLLGTTLVNLAREVLGVDLPLEALFQTPTVAGMTAAVAAARDTAGDAAPLVPVPRSGSLPLSFAQARMWFLHQLEPASPAYNIPFAVRLTGALDPAALTAAVREIVRRHETLRTNFPAVAGQAAQEIAPPAAAEALRVPLVDLGSLPPDRREAELVLLGALAARLPFDLAQGLLLRLALVRLAAGGEDHALLLTMHHIISDGWSIGVFVGEMAALYEDVRQGRAPSLPPLPLQYADFADWQRRRLSGEVLESHLAWWRARLAGQPAALDLPTDRPRGGQQGVRAGQRVSNLPAGAGNALRALAESAGVTPYIVFLAAFDTVLARSARQADVSVGTPTANRTRAEISGLIGFFVNTLVLRVDVGGDPAFRELVERAGEAALGAFAHQDLPFEKLVEELHPERALAVTPLFQVLLAYQNAPLPYVELPGLTFQGLATDTAAAMFDLTLTVGEIAAGPDAGGFRLSLEYAKALYDAATADRLLGHLARFLERALAEPGRRLSELPLLSEAERIQLLQEWNDTAREIADPAPAHHRVLRQAAERPGALAVAGGDLDLTYGDLADRAGRLATTLRELGAGPDAPVAVFLERSARLVVAELAALLAGAPYLPLDPTFPPERLAALLEGAGAPVVVTREGLREKLPEGTPEAPVVLSLESLESLDLFPPASPHPAELAYILFTSGSTGVPKGIEVPHGALTNLISWYQATYAPGPGDRAALVAGPSFDVSVGEIWPLLAAGASLHVPDDATRLSPGRLLEWLARERITLCFLPTPLAEAVLRELPEKLPPGLALRALLTAGDNLVRTPPPGLPFELFDQYGPAESTVYATWARIVPGPAGPAGPPIGRPLTNLRAWVLDPWLEPVPIGVPGEIFLGGAGLARGYRGRPDLTAERFLPSPFSSSEEPGQRLYRTGDLARRLADGQLEFLGRIDRQVKIRGFRIELGEVEAALARLPGVGAAAVVLRRDERGEARLAAWVAPPAGRAAPTMLELRRALRARLPEYMVPAVFVILPELPLTPSGKIDRDTLPEPVLDHTAERVAPRTRVEEALARIWSDLLNVPFERISMTDNFFDLGGHSLLAAQCVARVRDDLGGDLPLQSLFGNATLGDIADALVDAELSRAGDEELRALLAEYDGLSDEDLRALLAGGENE